MQSSSQIVTSPSIGEARQRAYAGVRSVKFANAFYRKDIALTLAKGPRAIEVVKAHQASESGQTYRALGVDLALKDAFSTNVHETVMQTYQGKGDLPQSIPGLVGLCGMPQRSDGAILVSRTSAVGTKLKIATSLNHCV